MKQDLNPYAPASDDDEAKKRPVPHSSPRREMPASFSLLASWLSPIVGVFVGMPIGIGAATTGNAVLVYCSIAFMLCFALLYPAYVAWRAYRARGWIGFFSTGVWVVLAYVIFVFLL